MEAGWRSSFGSSCSGGGDGGGGDSGGQNGNFSANNAWDIWDIGITTTTAAGTNYDWSNHDASSISNAATAARGTEASVVHALLFGDNNIHHAGVGSSSIHPRLSDPHMMCLKLGKRHYCENAQLFPDRQQHTAAESSSSTKKGKPPYPYHMTDTATTTTITVWPGSSPASRAPRCQVEGCGVVLSNTKEYYRRHKVCEIHSKAPKVVVLGLQQRFCQQCSRFHRVTEFDEAKRSCRRRLEGHNQRRRKGTLPNSLPRNFPHDTLTAERQFRASPPPPCALSLLSSPKMEPWVSSGDLSSRCSAALCELIAANRATTTTVVGHLWNQNGSDQQEVIDNTIQTPRDTQMWDRFNDEDQTTMTLDLMQASSSLGFWPFVHQGEV